jgi:hypothetical protein
MAQREGIKVRWKRLTRFLDAMAGGMEIDPHEVYRAHCAAIAARLDTIEKKLGPAARTTGDAAAPAT